MEDFLDKLKSDFPNFCFQKGKNFSFHPPKTIFLGPHQKNYELLSLHELSHALLGHNDYSQLIELLKMESEAWRKTEELATKYGVLFDEDFAEQKLDSYRDHLHKKSLCSVCAQPRPQRTNGAFFCPLCD